MGNRNPEVDALLAELDHPLHAEIARAREIVLGADPSITERVKWNAPSFCWHGDDRVTMKYQPPKQVQLVFHRGAKKVATPLEFTDDSGLIRWVAPDRGVVSFATVAEIESNRDALQRLVRAWMTATC